MADQAEKVAQLVRSIVVPLIDFPDELTISSQLSDEGHLRVEVHVHEEDAGKVIGRQGRVVKSIRTLARAAADGSISAVDVEIV